MKLAAALILTPLLLLGGCLGALVTVGAIAGGNIPSAPALQADGSGQITKAQFAAATLGDIGAPVTPSNIAKLVVWFQHESGGGGGDFNPLDYVTPTDGSTAYNSAGVQNYPDLATGIDMTGRLLEQSNTSAIHANLMQDGPWGPYVAAVAAFNAPWVSEQWRNALTASTPSQADQYAGTPINGRVQAVAPAPVTPGPVLAPVFTNVTGLKIVLAATQFVGIPYLATGDPGFVGHIAPDKWLAGWATGNPAYFGLECSMLVDVALLVALGLNLNYCSADYRNDPRFTRVPMDQLQPGDLVLRGPCGQTGHIAIVASYDPTTGKAGTIDAARHGTVVGFRAQQNVHAWSFTDAVRYTG